MEPLGVAVVGLGWWGRTIVPLLKDSAKLKVVCGVDIRPVALDGIRTLASYEEALRDPAVQGVVLCTPHTQRPDVLRAVKACNDNRS